VEHGEAIRDGLARLARDDAWVGQYSGVQRDRALRFWNEEKYAEARTRLLARHAASWTEERRREQTDAMHRYYRDPTKRAARGADSRRAWARDTGDQPRMQQGIARGLRVRGEITAERVRGALHATGSIRGAARLLECDRSVFRRFPNVLADVRGTDRRLNHKVAGVRELAGDHDVYCLTVPETGNFALAAGVFVRNCGIITNVTPFEPEWEGYVTLEISNTTPLPAKIYANEGIAQVLFFKGDEEPEVSYRDKKGKYQGQHGVTLPKL